MVVFIHLISLQKLQAMLLISWSSYTSLQCLTIGLLDVDCKNTLSIRCHEKDTKLFNTLKFPIGNVLQKSTG